MFQTCSTKLVPVRSRCLILVIWIQAQQTLSAARVTNDLECGETLVNCECIIIVLHVSPHQAQEQAWRVFKGTDWVPLGATQNSSDKLPESAASHTNWRFVLALASSLHLGPPTTRTERTRPTARRQ